MPFYCALLSAIALAGCFGKGGAGTYGYAGPTLEVTVNGIHLGPASPDPGASASLTNTHDPATGRITQSQFRASIGSTGAGAVCNLAFDRFGDGIPSIGVSAYQIAGASATGTADGTVTPFGGERVLGPGDSWQCTGTSCDGSLFVLSALDARHAQGYFQGTLASDSGGSPADVICSFYVAVAGWAP